MSGDNYFYKGADYGFDPNYGGTSQAYSSKVYSPQFAAGLGLSSDPRTANILKAVSEKLNTGATAVEVGQVSPEVFESIPKEHFKELSRLRQLLGKNVELTLHAPVIEPTGMTKRGWNPHEREQAERQMFDAVQKAHDLNPQGNVVTTFHSSAIGLPAETSIWEETGKGGKKVEVLKEAMVIDERTGEIANLPKLSTLEGEQKLEIEKKIDKMNRDHWYKNLQHVTYAADNGEKIISGGLAGMHRLKAGETEEPEERAQKDKKEVLKIYGEYAQGKPQYAEKLSKFTELYGPGAKEKVQDTVQTLVHGDIYLRDAYSGLRDMFDQAYAALRDKTSPEAKEKFERLESFKKEIQPKLNYLQDPEHVKEFAEEIKRGVDVLRSIDAVPIYRPFKEFAIDKSSETFSNVALKAYDDFRENTPIISIENPPAGFMISRAEDLKELVAKSREKFADKAVKELGLSPEKAKHEAEKILGATWDVGHINMIRKYGAGSEELREETKKIAPMVKHVHLSDNFGFEHTEIPMGMGNVPTKEMMGEVLKYNKNFKKIVEVGNWYQHFQTTPFAESMQHFDSPVYAMKNSAYFTGGSYIAGMGNNPEIHHAMYGTGFANLPIELGGQMSGKSRVSGNPLE